MIFGHQQDKKLYAAFLTGIIVLDNGLFNNRTLTWDNSCIGDICVSGGGKCVREQDCALKTDEAPKPEEGETRGVKIMIAFAGYDDILTPLSSAGSLPTKFTAFAWSSYFGQLVRCLTCSVGGGREESATSNVLTLPAFGSTAATGVHVPPSELKKCVQQGYDSRSVEMIHLHI